MSLPLRLHLSLDLLAQLPQFRTNSFLFPGRFRRRLLPSNFSRSTRIPELDPPFRWNTVFLTCSSRT